VKELPMGARSLDVGSRTSPLPALLAWCGYAVTMVQRDERFTEPTQVAFAGDGRG
jgi:hypothetical protein